jgi:hypothetical protein
MKNRTFFEQISEVDAAYAAALEGVRNESLAEIEMVALSWDANLKKIIDDNIDDEKERIKLLEEAKERFSDDYISPVFKAKISKISEIVFSQKIEVEHIKKLQKKLAACRTASSIEETIKDFRLSFINEDGLHYSIDKSFKPRHTIIYRLSQSINTRYSLDSVEVIAALNSIVRFPNFHNSGTLLFALAVSSGLGLSETSKVKHTIEEAPHILICKKSKQRNGFERRTLCKAKDFCRAQAHLAARKIGTQYADDIDTNIPLVSLNLAQFSFKAIPALYTSLIRHFNLEDSDNLTDIQSRYQFTIEGTHKIEEAHNLADDILKKRFEVLNPTQKSLAEALLSKVSDEPTQKVTIRVIKDWLACSTKTAQEAQKSILSALNRETL